MVQIRPDLEIPDSELRFTYARSGGPGGQNVNKVETKVILCFDVMASPSLSDEDKQRLAERLANRMSKRGTLYVAAQRQRTRAANQRDVTERFAELLREALHEEAPRRPTKVPRAAKRRRLESKRRRSELKRQRQGSEE